MKNTEELIIKNMLLADKLAYQKKKNLPKFVDIEDLKSAAYFGLVEAANRFQPELGVKFSTFAYIRIFGAIHDYLRENYKINKKFIIFSLEEDLKFNNIIFKDIIQSKKYVEHTESLELLTFGVEKQIKKIIQYYFIDGYSMKEVGSKLNLSESRICQLINKYKNYMKNKWTRLDLIEHLAA